MVLLVGLTQKLECIDPCVTASRRSSSVRQWSRYVPALVLVILILSGILMHFLSSVGESILSIRGPSITRGGILVGLVLFSSGLHVVVSLVGSGVGSLAWVELVLSFFFFPLDSCEASLLLRAVSCPWSFGWGGCHPLSESLGWCWFLTLLGDGYIYQFL